MPLPAQPGWQHGTYSRDVEHLSWLSLVCGLARMAKTWCIPTDSAWGEQLGCLLLVEGMAGWSERVGSSRIECVEREWHVYNSLSVSFFHTGKNFTISGHNQEIKEELAEIIELNGGHVVPLAGQEQSASIHYLVITAGGEDVRGLYHHCQDHTHHRQLISPSFLEDCVESQVMRLVILISIHWYY